MAVPFTGQVAITGTAQQLDASNIAGSAAAWSVKAPSTNANTVYIGPAGVTTGTGYPLTPGDEFEYTRMFNQITPLLQLVPTNLFAVGTAGSDVLAWFATP
jgi:hypothetical protein